VAKPPDDESKDKKPDKPKPDKLITVQYNGNSFQLAKDTYTTEELMGAFSVESGYVLDLIQDDGEFRQLQPGENIKIKKGLQFISHVPTGGSA
jgi:hypothetical protein